MSDPLKEESERAKRAYTFKGQSYTTMAHQLNYTSMAQDFFSKNLPYIGNVKIV